MLVFVLFMTFFLNASYSSNLKAFYLSATMPRRIESLSEVLENPNIKLIVVKGTFIESLLLNGQSVLYNRANKLLNQHPENRIHGEDTYTKGYDRVLDSDDLAMIVQHDVALQYINNNQPNNLYLAKTPVSNGLGHMVMSHQFIHKHTFNKEIARLLELGIL